METVHTPTLCAPETGHVRKEAAHRQVLFHRHPREDATPSGTIATASRMIFAVCQSVMLYHQTQFARWWRADRRITYQQGGFPRPVRANQRDNLALIVCKLTSCSAWILP